MEFTEQNRNPFGELKAYVLEELKKRYAATSVSLWFEPMEILRVTGTEVLLSFSESRRAFVQTNFMPALPEIFSAVMGAPMQVVLTSPEQQARMGTPAVQADEAEEKKSAYAARYNNNYTFDNFIVGKSNQLAYSAAVAVANEPFTLNNPLYFYGPSGLGKTHLLFATINHIRDLHPEYRIQYITGEEFTNELTESLAQKKPMMFREKYRNLDVLLVDDVQFIGGKMSIQEEFFHTFEALYQKNKQLIIASDVHPDQINSLEDRLRSRFSMGLVADIQPPDLELRTAIFRRKAMDYGFDMDYAVLSYLAENITQNIRQIEGAIKKLRAHCLINGEICTVPMAERVLKDFLRSQQVEGDIVEKAIDLVCKRFKVSREDLVGSKRTSEIAFARHYCIYLIRKKTTYTQKQIAKLFNKKDHTTILNSINVIEEHLRQNPVAARDTEIILDQLTK